MRYEPPSEGVHRESYPNGQPASEYKIKNGEHHGLYRRWHPNGVLAEKRHHKNGLLQGLAKQWSTRGNLLGTSKFRDGTGILREWYDNGQLKSELSEVRGELTGRMRLWAEDGMFIAQQYYFRDRQVSKKDYLQKCESDPLLPRFKDERPKNTLGNYVRRLRRERREQAKRGPTPQDIEEQAAFDAQCKAEAKAKDAKEIVSWLTKAKKPRELGELSRREARRFADKLYKFGAINVWVVGIERDPDGTEYSRRLIVALPREQENQDKIAKVCANRARPFIGGFGPAIPTGKKYMSVSLM